MKPPLITWIVMWAKVVALGAALYRPSRLRGPRVGIALYLAIGVGANLAAWLWTSYFRLGNNHFITYINQPLQGVALLWAIAEWQVIPVLRRTVRLCVPLVLVCWFVDLVVIGDTGNFSMFGLPVQGLVVLAAALMALVTRSVLAEEPVLRQGWYFILPFDIRHSTFNIPCQPAARDIRHSFPLSSYPLRGILPCTAIKNRIALLYL